ncbi:hypothetical protein Tco_0921256 [Tanacetum coccineum]
MSNKHQELTSPEQTAPGKDFSNPLIVDSLLKTIWSSMHHVITMKHWLVQSKRLLEVQGFIRSLISSLEVIFTMHLLRSRRCVIDGHSLSITEGSLRRHLKLDDQDGITSLPTTEIFAQLALMGYTTDSDKLTFQKGAFSPQWRFLIHINLHCLSPKKTAWEQFSSNIAAAVICLATNRKFNFSRMIFEHMVSNISSPHKFLMYPRFIQLCLDMQRHKLQQHTRFYSVPSLTMKVFSNMKRSTKGFSGQAVALFPTMLDDTEPSPSPSRITSSPSPTPSPSPEPSPTQPSPTQPSPTQPTPTQPSPTQLSPTQPGTEYHLPTPHDSPLHAVHSHGSDEGSLKLQELMNLVTTLSDRIGVLEADLLKTKKTYKETPTEVIQDQEGSGKASDEVSTAGLKKGTASEEVPTVSTAEVNLSTVGGTVTICQGRSSEEKNQGNYKISDFKGMSYNDIRPIFEKIWVFNQNIQPMDAEQGSKKQKSPEKERSTEKIVEEEVVTQEEREEVVKEPGAKRKKSIPRKSTRKRQKMEEDTEKEELKEFLDIIPREEVPIEVESISTKFPIVDWKSYVLTETFMYYQVFRGDGSSKNYKIFTEMLGDFDRHDVEQLYSLVKERYRASRPEGNDLMLWGDLHTMFEPNADDELWKNQHQYNLLSWSLYDFCGVHMLLMENGMAIHMLTEKKYPLSQEMISKMLKKRLEVDHESAQAIELLRFIRSQMHK